MSQVIVGFAPNQDLKGTAAVYWDSDNEHYVGACVACDESTVFTCDRWAVRRWAMNHRCPEGTPFARNHYDEIAAARLLLSEEKPE